MYDFIMSLIFCIEFSLKSKILTFAEEQIKYD
jgi:hypothetical protein